MTARLGSMLVAISIALQTSGAGVHAAEPEPFYKGKTIQFIVGYGPGGGYDLYARFVAQHFGRYIPGNPNIVVRNMPGGGGRVATGYAYKIAPQDGTVLVTADQGLIIDQALEDPGIQFDLSKMPAIGNPIAENNNLVTWHSSGIRTIEDARHTEVTVGANPGASTQVPLTMNAVLGTRFKIVSGYTGGNEINLAMERGEVLARGQNSFAAWRASKPDWLHDNKLNFIVQWGPGKQPDYAQVPLLGELSSKPDERALLEVFTVPTILGRPIFTTPNVPADRVAILRTAFDQMVTDADFLDAAQKASFDINPISGPRMSASIKTVIDMPAAVRKRLKEIVSTQ